MRNFDDLSIQEKVLLTLLEVGICTAEQIAYAFDLTLEQAQRILEEMMKEGKLNCIPINKLKK